VSISPGRKAPGKVVVETKGPSFFGRHQFLIYRLFSLAGLIPIGAYLVVHLLTNATILNGPATYQSQVDRIHSLGIILPIVEWVFIFLPILFHAVIGLVIISGAMPNAAAYPYNGNIRYTLQRATGMIAFAFILWHVIQMHKMGAGLGGGRFDAEAASSTVAKVLQPLSYRVLYGIGVLASVYHLANGLWTQGITWGIWTTEAAMRRAGWICLAFGIFLGIIGLSSLYGFSRLDVKEAETIEQRMEQLKKIESGEAPVASPGAVSSEGK
jgi:succinate dehydrogenase / fumarate reductase, cytochrome b subunit